MPFIIGFLYFTIRTTAQKKKGWFWYALLGGAVTDVGVALLLGYLESIGQYSAYDYQYELGNKLLIHSGLAVASAILFYLFISSFWTKNTADDNVEEIGEDFEDEEEAGSKSREEGESNR